MATTYQAEQIRRFLEAVDRHLREPAQLVIIGGGAALLQHGAKSPTRDIDTFGGPLAAVKLAAAQAAAELGYAVPLGSAPVADLPLNYQDRQLRPLPQLKRLDVLVPDRYDLVLSKLVRAHQADLAVCKEIYEANPLELGVLLDRYLQEMGHAIGRQNDRDMNLVAGIELMWDAKTADLAERRTQAFRAQEQTIPRHPTAKHKRSGRTRR